MAGAARQSGSALLAELLDAVLELLDLLVVAVVAPVAVDDEAQGEDRGRDLRDPGPHPARQPRPVRQRTPRLRIWRDDPAWPVSCYEWGSDHRQDDLGPALDSLC